VLLTELASTPQCQTFGLERWVSTMTPVVASCVQVQAGVGFRSAKVVVQLQLLPSSRGAWSGLFKNRGGRNPGKLACCMSSTVLHLHLVG
jgi:hypothetical protein